METPNNSAEQLVVASPTSQGEGDKDDTVTANQPIVAPVANDTVTADAAATTDTTAKPDSQGDGANDPIESAKPLEPMVELRVYRSNTSQEDLDEEAVVLMRTIRECIISANQLTTVLVGQADEGFFGPFQTEIAILDATMLLLISTLSESAYLRATPTREQLLRRAEIQRQYDVAIKRLQRPPTGEGAPIQFPPLPMSPAQEPKPLGRPVTSADIYKRRCETLESIFDEADAHLAAVRRRAGLGSSRGEQGGEEVDNSGLDGPGWLYDVD